jgi:two-component system response regulator GlrR
MAGERILVVDDEPNIRILLQEQLEPEGYQVTLVASGEEALSRSATQVPDLAIVDLMLPDMDGMALIERLVESYPNLPILMLTAHGTITNAVNAIKKGATDFLVKPFETTDLLTRVEKALEVQQLKSEVKRWRTFVQERYQFDHIITGSEHMRQILRQVAQIAASEATVCLYGESGTGKELIAKALHISSRRSKGPFIAINCGAIPEGLLENELFGHVKGAYTGADTVKRGLLQQAEGGTLFLDEVGELPLALQVKFLRVLQEREFYAVGAEQPTKSDIRLVAATNQDLNKAVTAGKFRHDLYYRLHVIPVFLPPLRERREDIPLLAHHFLCRYGQTLDKEVRGFTPAAMQQLLDYTWPGNVRELANVVERAAVLTPTAMIAPEVLLLDGKPQPSVPLPEPLPPPVVHPLEEVPVPQLAQKTIAQAREELEREYLLQVLRATKGIIARAAKLAGIKRSSFYSLVHRYGIDVDSFKTR